MSALQDNGVSHAGGTTVSMTDSCAPIPFNRPSLRDLLLDAARDQISVLMVDADINQTFLVKIHKSTSGTMVSVSSENEVHRLFKSE